MFAAACKAKRWDACAKVGHGFLDNSQMRDPTKAFQMYTYACQNGSDLGCFYLAEMYVSGPLLYGEGVPQDLVKGRAMLETLCANNLVVVGGMACSQLGFLVGEGRGGIKDSERAVRLFQRGCELHDIVGCDGPARLRNGMRQAPPVH